MDLIRSFGGYLDGCDFGDIDNFYVGVDRRIRPNR